MEQEQLMQQPPQPKWRDYLMNCPECNETLMIANNRFEAETKDDVTEIYSILNYGMYQCQN